MTANHVTGGLIPDDWFHITELGDRAFELFVFLVTGLQVFSWVI
jgi:hypothetical protein